MPIKELVERYKGKPREALRKAARAELPGATDLFVALEVAAKNRNESDDWRRLHNALIRARETMFAEIARRYDLKSAKGETDGDRT